MIQRKHRLAARCLPALALAAAGVAQAQTGRFDLLGPKVDVHVTRGDRSLPIASVPNLLPGDKLQVHADLPTSQSVHLLLVIAFLRGTTNPPPDKWFTRIETWDKRVRGEGILVTVPEEAQQALIFIAPETGGDFSTLKSAVRGRPGTFVRAAQDLNEASFEQSRIERYAQAIKQVPPGSAADLLDHSHKLAATLQLKPNDDCFKRPADLQAACLSQSGSALLLDDGHGQTMAQMLSSGPTSDLIGAVAGTPVATAGGAGAYSAYVGTVLDVVRLMSGLHTAKYQYIPAIAFPEADALNLRLNTAPSFNNPKSVIVIGLPAIQKAVPPPLQLQDARHVSCLLQPRMVLPLAGAPLVFATGFAHDLTLHLNEPGPDGRTDLPLVPDAYEGGLIVTDVAARKPLAMVAPEVRTDGTTTPATPPSAAAAPAVAASRAAPAPPAAPLTGSIQGTGTVRGFWGFDAFNGPTLPLQRQPGQGWSVVSQGELFTGRSNTIALHSSGTACVASVAVGIGSTAQPLDWRVQDSGSTPTVLVKLPLEKTAPGGLNLTVRQYDGGAGTDAVQTVALHAYADGVRAEELVAHAGDHAVTLRGSGLGGVVSVTVNGATLVPVGDQAQDEKSLRMEPQPDPPGKAPVFKAGDTGSAQVKLKDGRTMPVSLRVESARPSVTLLNTSFQAAPTAGLPFSLGDPHAIPLEGKLTFSLRSETPVKFARAEKVEVALADGSLSTTLSLADRTLVLQDTRTALGYLSPSAVFGPSAFGLLQFRVLAADGTTSDWLPLGTLVRTPVVRQFACGPRAANARSGASSPATPEPEPATAETPCTLEGSNLFLIDAVSGSAAFTVASEVPAGFAAETLQVPRPADGHTLYLRLRDDPSHPATITSDTQKIAKGSTRP